MKSRWADASFPITTTYRGVATVMEEWHVAVRGHEFAVPVGFVSDGASVPRALRWLCGDPEGGMSMTGYFGGLLLWLATTIEKALRRLRGGKEGR